MRFRRLRTVCLTAVFPQTYCSRGPTSIPDQRFTSFIRSDISVPKKTPSATLTDGRATGSIRAADASLSTHRSPIARRLAETRVQPLLCPDFCVRNSVFAYVEPRQIAARMNVACATVRAASADAGVRDVFAVGPTWCGVNGESRRIEVHVLSLPDCRGRGCEDRPWPLFTPADRERSCSEGRYR